ncbi:MAG: glycosyltransferase [Planctomycetaceae bacterium]|nr:glycosyltransferase [Planctomycetaceae bacterium]
MKVSIITASFNYEQFIGQTIESVQAQTFTDWEMIIVDDGSSDRSAEIIQEYAARDSRIRFFTHPDGKNHGLAATVQLGLQKAEAPWVAFLECDDIFMPTSIEEKLEAAENYPQTALIFTDLEMFGERDESKEKYFEKLRPALKKLTYPTSMVKEFFTRNPIPTFSVVMVRKELLQKCDFTPLYPPWLDYWLWVQLAHYPYFFIDKPLTRWRVHQDSYLNRKKLDQKLYQKQISLFEKRLLKKVPWGFWGNYWLRKFKEKLRKFRQSIISINLGRRRIIFLTKEWKW